MEKPDIKDELFELLPDVAAYVANPTRCPDCQSDQIVLSTWEDRIFGFCFKCETEWEELHYKGKIDNVRLFTVEDLKAAGVTKTPPGPRKGPRRSSKAGKKPRKGGSGPVHSPSPRFRKPGRNKYRTEPAPDAPDAPAWP